VILARATAVGVMPGRAATVAVGPPLGAPLGTLLGPLEGSALPVVAVTPGAVPVEGRALAEGAGLPDAAGLPDGRDEGATLAPVVGWAGTTAARVAVAVARDPNASGPIGVPVSAAYEIPAPNGQIISRAIIRAIPARVRRMSTPGG